MTKGIWKHRKYFKPEIDKLFQLTIGEGNTPCDQCKKLAQVLGLEKVYLKREDKNPSGSFKDRSLAFQLAAHLQKGQKNFVISSTGNAAISSISYCKTFKSTLNVFVSKKIPADKLLRLTEISGITKLDHSKLASKKDFQVRNGNIFLNFSNKPKTKSIRFAKKNKSVHLRGSNDDLATVGFKTISYELIDQAQDADSIFIPCSSGTSTVGIFQGYYDKKSTSIPIFINQTTKIHPMASVFDKAFEKTDTSLASAISDRVARRKDQVTQIASKSGGGGYVISDNELMTAQSLFQQECGLNLSYDPCLSLAGLMKALQNESSIKRPILLISGK